MVVVYVTYLWTATLSVSFLQTIHLINIIICSNTSQPASSTSEKPM